ncbi:COX15/CtaA family protein [Glycomyces halotolerans]
MNLLQRWFSHPAAVRRWALASLIANVGIVVTGGAVRLTGSGLGCAEWPNCSEGQLTATPAMGIHGAIEFGNRMLTFVLVALALAALVAAWTRTPRRPSLVRLALGVLAFVPVQAVIGGITVWTDLNPWVVGLHFLASIVILGIATALYLRSGEPDGPVEPLVPRPVVVLGRALAAVAFAVIALGVVVTGSGPHAGDPESPRNGLDSEFAAQLHADGVWLLLGLTLAMVAALHAVRAPEAAKRAAHLLVAVELLQGLIGYVQYYTGLPELLVGMHMLGASLLWISAIALVFTLRKRLPQASSAPVTIVAGDESDAEPADADTAATNAEPHVPVRS